MEPITEVIFRKFNDPQFKGDIIALFPYIIEDRLGSVNSYMHTGQHSPASLTLIGRTSLATEKEYSDLFKELTQIGYNLKVIKKVNTSKHRTAMYKAYP